MAIKAVVPPYNVVDVRECIKFLMAFDLKEWFVPRQVRAHLIDVNIDITEDECSELMEDIYQEAKDLPLDNYERKVYPNLRYRCMAFFSPA